MATSLQRLIGFRNVAFRLVYDDRTYIREPGDRLETDLGVIDIPDDASSGDTLETHLGHQFVVRDLRLRDWFHHFDRSGAPMLPRDIGLILGETGIGVGDRVADIGTGTGVLAAAMANAGATVITYERDDDAAALAQENMILAGVADTVEIRNVDGVAIVEDLAEPVDVLTLDSGDAPYFVAEATELIVPGGFLAAYSPFVESAREVVEAARTELTDVSCIETIQRPLDIDDRGTRPSTGPVGHTGYLTFARVP